MDPSQFDQPASEIDQVKQIADFKASPPPTPFSHTLLAQMGIQVHADWKGNPMVNGELIVVLDKNGNLTAMGYPHGSAMVLFERRPTRRVAVHTIGNSIVGHMYDIVKMTNMINGDWAWEPDKGMSIATLMQMFGTA